MTTISNIARSASLAPLPASLPPAGQVAGVARNPEPNRYFGVNASYPKPMAHWNAQKNNNERAAISPIPIHIPSGVSYLSNERDEQFIANDLTPPFSRVHYQRGRLEDSGIQGEWNTLGHSSSKQGGLQSFDRSPELSKSPSVSLEKYAQIRDPRSVKVTETTFDRIICHTSCAPVKRSDAEVRGEEYRRLRKSPAPPGG